MSKIFVGLNMYMITFIALVATLFSSLSFAESETLMHRLVERQTIYLDQSSPSNHPRCPKSLSFSSACEDGSNSCIEVKGEPTVWIKSQSVNQGRVVDRVYSRSFNNWTKVIENVESIEHLLKIKTSMLSRDGYFGPLSGFVPLFTHVRYRDNLLLQETESGILMFNTRSNKGEPSRRLKCVYQKL